MSKSTGLDLILHQLGLMAPTGYAIGLHIRFAAPLMTFQTYDERWIERYTEQGYGLRDPLIGWGMSQTGACRWSDLNVPDPFGIMAEALEYGLVYGVAVACGPISSRSIAGISRADREFTDGEMEAISALIHRLHDVTEPPAHLTKAQQDALRLIANGDRHAAAAAKLGISESALKARLNSAKDRLMARTTAEAIQRAKEYRLL
jgi:LuxR family transcriptional regulator